MTHADYRDLPILEELEDDLRIVFDAGPTLSREAANAGARAHTPARGFGARRRGSQSTAKLRGQGRRAATLAGVLALVGATALAERSLDRGEQVNTEPTLLSAADVGGERWELRAYRHDGDVCQAVVVDADIASACEAAPTHGHVRAMSLLGPRARYVVGLTGPRAATVVVTVAGQRTSAAAVAIDAAVRQTARLPPGLRWFVVRFPITNGTGDAPARLTTRDADGHALGRPLLDCSLGQESPSCMALARRRAQSPPTGD